MGVVKVYRRQEAENFYVQNLRDRFIFFTCSFSCGPGNGLLSRMHVIYGLYGFCSDPRTPFCTACPVLVTRVPITTWAMENIIFYHVSMGSHRIDYWGLSSGTKHYHSPPRFWSQSQFHWHKWPRSCTLFLCVLWPKNARSYSHPPTNRTINNAIWGQPGSSSLWITPHSTNWRQQWQWWWS